MFEKDFYKLNDDDIVSLCYDKKANRLKIVQYLSTGWGNFIKKYADIVLPPGTDQKTVPLGMKLDVVAIEEPLGWKTDLANAKLVLKWLGVDWGADPNEVCSLCNNTGAMELFNFYTACSCGRKPRSIDGDPLEGNRWLANELDFKKRK